MNKYKYKLSMKTPSGLGSEFLYVESKYDNFERYLKEHNLKYQKCDFKTIQDKEIERLHFIIKEVREYIEKFFQDDEGLVCEMTGKYTCKRNEHFIDDLLGILDKAKE